MHRHLHEMVLFGKLFLCWNGDFFFSLSLFCPCVTAALWFTFFFFACVSECVCVCFYFFKQSHIFSRLPPPWSGVLLLLSVHLAQAKKKNHRFFWNIFFSVPIKPALFQIDLLPTALDGTAVVLKMMLKHFSTLPFTSCYLQSRWQSSWLIETDVVMTSGHNPHKDDELPLWTNSQVYFYSIIFHQQQECGRAPSVCK